MNRIKPALLCLLLWSFLSTTAVAEQRSRFWFEAGIGISHFGVGLHLKNMSGNKGWGLSYAYMGTDNGNDLFDEIIDRDTNESVAPGVILIGASGIWGYPFRFGYTDFSAGIAYATGDWTNNCSPSRDTFSPDRCDVIDISNVGIPLRASVALGKYAGLGLAVEAFYSSFEQRVSVSVFASLGQFTR